MKSIEWYRGNGSIPRWKNLNISHGFLGVGANVKDLHEVNQVHGTSIIQVSELEASSKADAISSDDHRRVAVKTADCVPILLWSPLRVAAVHAGWRGMCAGIIEIAMQHVLEKARVSDIMVGIGPCIGRDAFEIGPEVIDKFLVGNKKHIPICANKGAGDRWHLQLNLLAVLKFLELRCCPKNISVNIDCTFKNSGLWHSYRRDGNSSGRNFSWVAL